MNTKLTDIDKEEDEEAERTVAPVTETEKEVARQRSVKTLICVFTCYSGHFKPKEMFLRLSTAAQACVICLLT